MTSLHISSQFDGGNIRVINKDNPEHIQLEINKDVNSGFYQWFYYRVGGAEGQPLTMHLNNAPESSYAKGWIDYRAVASYDREHWFRVDTAYDGEKLTIQHTPECNTVYYAYFAPYSMERHHDLIAWAQQSAIVQTETLGDTLDGQPMDLLKIGAGEGKRTCWVIARQHPGETMAEWWMEGFLQRLLDPACPVARELLKKAVFYVVPNMNPDGSRRGYLRSNACGANLNREWAAPTPERSPEVLLVRNKMDETGVDLALDVHGDEALPYNFIAAAEGIPSWTDRLNALTENYLQALVQASPDFQTEFGYPKDEPGKANMTVCTAALAERFDCLSMTLEMPFKDTVDSPDEYQGWSPERSQALGAANLNAMFAVIDHLRQDA
ncbi:M14-type cytosolic carboxypeptidase [Endozoicomonas sp. ISHI1]|uniref:M14 family metallopeptidase n=1 Tax=Endozoicomonas sp. ISHI1 TaxID=2825882 RepID=UPI002148D3F1|nr:M14-type cytosolic carboxypeptidase [Endozoicomonas sp. ISHI1]